MSFRTCPEVGREVKGGGRQVVVCGGGGRQGSKGRR